MKTIDLKPAITRTLIAMSINFKYEVRLDISTKLFVYGDLYNLIFRIIDNLLREHDENNQ